MSRKRKEVFVTLDVETKSKISLKDRGGYVYSKDPSTDLLCLAFKFSNSETVHLWTLEPVKGIKTANKKTLEKLLSFPGPIVAHNYLFEYWIISNILVPRYNWPKQFLNLSRYRCTMATAFVSGLPGGLNAVARLLKLKNQKMVEEGSKLLNKYSKPYKDRKTKELLLRDVTLPENLEDFKTLIEYNKQDTRVTEELYNKLPKLHENNFEDSIFRLDGAMNTQGLKIDKLNLKRLVKSYETYFEKAGKQAEKLAGLEKSGTLTVKSSVGFKNWLTKMWWYDIPNVQQYTLNVMLDHLEKINNPDKETKNIIKALKLRRVLSAAAPKKLKKITDTLSEDNHVRGFIQYGAAQTLRWAGRGFQPQNLPRSSSENFTKDVKDLTSQKIPLENCIETFNSLLRQLIIPLKGNYFLIGDFAAIEARVLFWLSGCKTGLQQYRDRKDIYSEFAGQKIYNIDLKQVTKTQRFVGKTSILGLSYGMGQDKFFETCKNYGIDINYHIAQKAVKNYRKTYKEVCTFWRKIETYFKRCIEFGKIQVYEIPESGGKVLLFEKTAQTLTVTFPSGRKQFYFHPFVKKDTVRFWHKSRKLIAVWGGVLVENIVQGVSRDLLAGALLDCKNSKLLTPVLTVHDEILAECKISNKVKALKEFQKIMVMVPKWAQGLPLGAECVSAKRYRKI